MEGHNWFRKYFLSPQPETLPVVLLLAISETGGTPWLASMYDKI